MIESLQIGEIGRRRWANALAAVGISASLVCLPARSQSRVAAHAPDASPATFTSLSALVAMVEQGDDARAESAVGATLNGGQQVTRMRCQGGLYRSPEELMGFRSGEDQLKRAQWVAIARVRHVGDEPTNLGGDYISFDIVRILRGQKATFVGVGGHGWKSNARAGDLFLVSLSRDSICVDSPFPPFTPDALQIDAVVNGMRKIATIDEGVALLKDFQTTPGP